MQSLDQQMTLNLALQGDLEAKGLLFESFRPYVRCIMRALGPERIKSRLEESDFIQEVFLEAHRFFSDFRGSTVPELTGWMRKITIRTTGHLLRSHRAAKRDLTREDVDAALDLVLASTSPSEIAMQHELAVRLASAVTQLPEDMQEVIFGRQMDGTSYEILAARLGRSERAVRVLHFRALGRLRETLGDLNPEPLP